MKRPGLIWRGVCQGAALIGRACGGGLHGWGAWVVLGAPRAEVLAWSIVSGQTHIQGLVTVKAPDFRAQPGRGERVYPTKTAEPFNRLRVTALRCQLLVHADQRATTLHEPLDRDEVVDECHVRGRVTEAKRRQPLLVRLRPCLARGTLPSPQKELREAMTGAHQILAGVLHTPHQITELLISDARNERKGQLTRAEQPHQPPCVTPVGLHPVTRGLRDRPRRHDPHIKPTLLRCAREGEPRRARLIHRAHRTIEILQEHRHPRSGSPRSGCTRSSPLTGSRTAATVCAW